MRNKHQVYATVQFVQMTPEEEGKAMEALSLFIYARVAHALSRQRPASVKSIPAGMIPDAEQPQPDASSD